MLVPASMFLVPVQATTQEQPSLTVSTELGGIQEIPLKAIKDSNGEIDTQNDFEIEPQDVITITDKSNFQVQASDGTVSAVKVTDEKRLTTPLQFSKTHGTVVQGLASKAYLLDVIVDTDNGDQFLFETVLAILRPGQTLNQINTQNIIQNFVSSTSDTHTTVVFKEDNDNENEPENSRAEICRFTPSHPICAPDEDGSCGEGFAMNEDGQCFPRGKCPDGYTRPNDDETGACISKERLDQCPDGSWKYPADSCYIPNPPPVEPIEEASNDTSSEAEDEQPECEDGFLLENGECEPLTSNCGGEPCTASQKEDSTTSDPVPGEPHTPSEETEEIEEEEETEAEPEEQEEPNPEESD